MKPGEYVVEVFGGVTKAANALGVSPGAVSRWKSGKRRMGPDVMIKILKTAKKLNLDITTNDLIFGR